MFRVVQDRLQRFLPPAGVRFRIECDGPEGFVFCALSGVSVAVRHWKHRERIRARRAS